MTWLSGLAHPRAARRIAAPLAVIVGLEADGQFIRRQLQESPAARGSP
jgi:hypothetical protein